MSYQNETKELDSLYALAKEEQKNTTKTFLVWAGGDAPKQQDQLFHQFKKRFPGIDIEIVVDLSKYHDLKVYEQLNDGYLEPDVVMLQTLNDFENWKKIDVLEPYKPAGFQHIREGYFRPRRTFYRRLHFCILTSICKRRSWFYPKELR